MGRSGPACTLALNFLPSLHEAVSHALGNKQTNEIRLVLQKQQLRQSETGDAARRRLALVLPATAGPSTAGCRQSGGLLDGWMHGLLASRASSFTRKGGHRQS